MKFLSLICTFLLVASAISDPIDPKCDRILTSMSDGCKSIRSSLLTPTSMEPKVLCCTQMRYDICVQSVSAYSTIAKATRICPAENYDLTLTDLRNNIAMAGVQKLCEKFDRQTCITDPIGSAWNSVKTNLNENMNVDVDRIGEQIGKNWNQAISSLGNFAKGVQDQIAAQDIPGQLRKGASALQSGFQERTKQLSDIVSGQGVNRYSVVDADGKSQDSLSLDSIIHSVVPEVEIVEKKPEEKLPEVVPEVAPKKRFSFMDWFSSLTSSRSPVQSNSDPVQNNPNNIVQRNNNPYSFV